MSKLSTDFRQIFDRMAPQAVINKVEMAALLATTIGAVTQMAYRGELPPTAFPDKRRACWFVGDVRNWLDAIARNRGSGSEAEPTYRVDVKLGRPRLPVE
jgi:hypothetical protein